MQARHNLSPGMETALSRTGACFKKTTKSPSQPFVSGFFASSRRANQPAPVAEPENDMTLASIDISNADANDLQKLLDVIQRVAPSAMIFLSTSDTPTATKSPARPK